MTMPDELWDRLRQEAERKNISISELVRRYLEDGLERKGQSMSGYSNSARDIAVAMDRYKLYGEGLIVE